MFNSDLEIPSLKRSNKMGVSRIAIIGSFRQHYEKVIQALEVFQSISVEITTPKGANIIKKGIPFVRFESDYKEWTDEMVQVVALHRILRADITFVVNVIKLTARF